MQGPFSMVSSQALHAPKPPEQVAPGVASQNVSAEIKSSSRKELPAVILPTRVFGVTLLSLLMIFFRYN